VNRFLVLRHVSRRRVFLAFGMLFGMSFGIPIPIPIRVAVAAAAAGAAASASSQSAAIFFKSPPRSPKIVGSSAQSRAQRRQRALTRKTLVSSRSSLAHMRRSND
jgi:hypothetical protein